MQKCNKSVRFLMIMFLVLVFIIAGIGLMACNKNAKSIEKLTIDGGKLVVTYSDGTTDPLPLPTNTGAPGEPGPEGPIGVGIASLAWEDGKLVATLTNGEKLEVEIPELPVPGCTHETIDTVRVRQDGYNDEGKRDCLSGAVDLLICRDCQNCDAVIREPSKAEHVWQETIIDATCTTEKYKTSTCANCDQQEGKEVLAPANGHSWVAAYTSRSDEEPVCLFGGFLLGLCDVCGHTATAEEVAADPENEILVQLADEEGNFSNPVRVAPIGHQIEKLTAAGGVAPTTTATGTLIGPCSCKGCSFTKTITIPKLSRANYEHEVVAGKSCNEDGAIKYTLSTWQGLPVEGGSWTSAGQHVKNEVEYAKGQLFLEGKEDTAKVGVKLIEGQKLVCDESVVENAGLLCDDCDTIVYVTYRKPHVEVPGTRVEVEATCITDGSIDFDCSVCLKHVHQVVPATGEHMMDYTITEELGADGKVAAYIITGKCTTEGCTESYGPEKAKKVVKEVVTAATCVTEGEVKYTVTLLNDNEIEILGKLPKTLHKDSTGAEIQKYTAAAPYRWNLNGDNGQMKLIEDVDPTCAMNGFQVGFNCSVCDQMIILPAIVPHTAPKGTTVPASVCTQEEADKPENQYVCEVCNQTVKPFVTGHSFGQVKGVQEDKDGDGTKEWYAVKECSVCKYVEYLNNGEPIVIPEGATAKRSQASTCAVAGFDVYDVAVKDGEATATIEITIERALANHKYANGVEITAEEREKVHALIDTANPLGIKYFEGQKTECSGTPETYNGGVLCPVCDKIIPLYVSAPHTWGAEPETGKQVKVTPATCTTAEVIEKYCTKCGAWKVDETADVQPALGHDYKATIVVGHEPTDAAEGQATVTCTRCSEINVTITLPKLTDAAWTKTEKAKTCVEDGKITYTAELKVYADKDVKVKVTYIITLPADGHHDFITVDGEVVKSTWYTVDKHDPANIVVTKYVGSYCKVEEIVIVTFSTTLDADNTALTESDIPEGVEVLDITAEHEVTDAE